MQMYKQHNLEYTHVVDPSNIRIVNSISNFQSLASLRQLTNFGLMHHLRNYIACPFDSWNCTSATTTQ